MKKIVMFLSLILSNYLNAQTTYFISNDGSDTNIGTEENFPWQTLERLNQAFESGSIVNGDIIKLRKNDVFLGQIKVNKNSITLTNYGDPQGQNPTITGFVKLPSTWTEVNAGLYQIDLSKIPVAENLIMFAKSKKSTKQNSDYFRHSLKLARYPDETYILDRPLFPYSYYEKLINGGYINYHSINYPNSAEAPFPAHSSGIIESTNIPGLSEVDLRTAEICIRTTDFSLDRYSIEDFNRTGNTISFKEIPHLLTNPLVGNNIYIHKSKANEEVQHGYFFQNALSFANRYDEWFFDNENRIMYLNQAMDVNNGYTGNNPNDSSFYISTIETLLDFRISENISVNTFTVDGIDFSGANGSAIVAMNTSDATIINCKFNNIGSRGIQFYNVANVNINKCQFNYCLSNAVQCFLPYNGVSEFCNIKDCDITNTAPYIGMSSHYDPGDNNAIHANGSKEINTQMSIEKNIIKNVGKGGIYWQGSSVNIDNNVIINAVNTLGDWGAIYTYWDKSIVPDIYSNRSINHNLIGDLKGEPFGATKNRLANGIYLDGQTRNVNVVSNSVYNCPRRGIAVNHPKNVLLKGNTLFNNTTGINIARFLDASCSNGEPSIDIENNIIYSIDNKHRNIAYANSALNFPNPNELSINELLTNAINPPTDPENSETGMVIDNNYYGVVNPHPFVTEDLSIVTSSSSSCSTIVLDQSSIYTPVYTSPNCFENWKNISRQDMHSTAIREYKLHSYEESDIVPNTPNTGNDFVEDFEDNNLHGGQIEFSGTSVPTIELDGNGQIGGHFSIKVNMPPSTFTAEQPFQQQGIFFNRIGAPTSGLAQNARGQKYFGRSYILKFRTKGSSINGRLEVFIKASASLDNYLDDVDYRSKALSPIQTATFNEEIVDHEFLLTPDLLNYVIPNEFPIGQISPGTQLPESLDAYFVIRIKGNSGITYIDDIEFHEVLSYQHPLTDYVKFITNPDRQQAEIQIWDGGNYVDLFGNNYSGSVQLPPYSSVLLFRDVTGNRSRFISRSDKDNVLIPEKDPSVLSCFPNPAHDKLNIQIPNHLNVEKLAVFDITGRPTGIFDLVKNKSLIQLSIDNLLSGTYLITFYCGNGQIRTQKFIKY